MPPARNRPARDWCYTSYNEQLQALLRNGELTLHQELRYHVCQLEECPDTGRVHVQGFLIFKKPARFSRVRAVIGDDQVHVEERRGSRDQAADYCKDEAKRLQGTESVELGTMGGQGTRTDLQRAREIIQEGGTLADLFLNEETFEAAVRYPRGLQLAVDTLQAKPPRSDVEVHALIGEPGVGKSYGVRLREPNLFVVDPPNGFGGQVWFDGYQQEPAILFDDYEGWLPWSLLLRILDRYPVRLQVKCGSVNCAATRIYLTSNKPPEEWHPRQPFAALQRRITHRWQCHNDRFERIL